MLVKAFVGLVLDGFWMLFTKKFIVAPLATVPPLRVVRVACKEFPPNFVHESAVTETPAEQEIEAGRVMSEGKSSLSMSPLFKGELAVTEI